jgi:dihydroxyacetone kinase
MSYLVNDPAAFRDEMIGGLVSANDQFICQARGGVVRATETPPGQVAIIIGGGSGHFPAFAGLVGQGLAHGAAMGNVFASPSADEIYGVARAAASDAGVFMSYGNYAGDVLHFTEAMERLHAAGIPCRQLPVTDDICSAGNDERSRRRGIAGMFAVFRAAAYAAEQGQSLDEVWEAANAANDRVRSMGVAFSGCTLPGKDKPLFTVPHGKMGVGMGIHGEPGIEEQDLPTARGLGRMMVDRLVGERPDHVDTDRVGVILNGLGAVKYEELFLTYASVEQRLKELNYAVVQPEVGELVTSFEMAGVSLSLIWLDDALEAAWTSPAATPAYRRGAVNAGQARRQGPVEMADDTAAVEVASDASRGQSAQVVAAFAAIRDVIEANVDYLGEMDAIAGDGDHGIGMQRGSAAAHAAAVEAAARGAGAGAVFDAAGHAWSDKGGGTSGALWGLGLRAIGAIVGNQEAASRATIARGVARATAEVLRVGKAQAGDKTMLDALIPFAEDLEKRVANGETLASAWEAAAGLATREAKATADLLPRVGRARPHAEKSVGTPDPGAISMALAVTAVGSVLNQASKS